MCERVMGYTRCEDHMRGTPCDGTRGCAGVGGAHAQLLREGGPLAVVRVPALASAVPLLELGRGMRPMQCVADLRGRDRGRDERVGGPFTYSCFRIFY
jgi:hypothetical protein